MTQPFAELTGVADLSAEGLHTRWRALNVRYFGNLLPPDTVDLPRPHKRVRQTSKAAYALGRVKFSGRKGEVLRWLAGFWNRFQVAPTSGELLTIWAESHDEHLVFAGREHLPMTVQLNNIINTTTGTRMYNVNMAATLLTAGVPLLLYFVAGRWLVRGITAGAVKG